MRLAAIFEKLNKPNDGTRSLFESIAVPEVAQALRTWITGGGHGVLIGGCAASYYATPRASMDVDVLFLHSGEIPDQVSGFKRTRSGAFQHNATHVEVEIITPQMINLSTDLAQKVIDTSIESDGIRVASPTGIVALKLNRLKRHDIGDIVDMINTGKVDLTGWPVSVQNSKDFEEISTRFV
jgi:hypothetical protein